MNGAQPNLCRLNLMLPSVLECASVWPISQRGIPQTFFGEGESASSSASQKLPHTSQAETSRSKSGNAVSRPRQILAILAVGMADAPSVVSVEYSSRSEGNRRLPAVTFCVNRVLKTPARFRCRRGKLGPWEAFSKLSAGVSFGPCAK